MHPLVLRISMFLALVVPAVSLVAQDAASANKAFVDLQNKWMTLEKKYHEKQQANPDDKQLLAMRKESDKLLDALTTAGLEVYRIDPKGYPVVNQTLLAIANFHVLGDPNGDGGDQYEKALPLVKQLIDAGAATDYPELWQLGAVSAYATNDYKLAQEYFIKANSAGMSGKMDRLGQLARSFQESMGVTKNNWTQEELIRGAEKVADNLPRVKLTTSRGDVVIELFENEAPQAVANFLTLVKQGFYKDVPFHRVLPGFMAQGGDPTGTGGGGPGYSIRCECFGPNYRKHFRGSLSMAHAGRDTGGSQFFLTYVPTTYLDGRHTVFGRVVEGMDVAASLKRRDPDRPGRSEPDKILSAEVLRDRGHEYKFEKLPER
jgi:cyclophilin family peptidyl-prolyl cis-trans isomerase